MFAVFVGSCLGVATVVLIYYLGAGSGKIVILKEEDDCWGLGLSSVRVKVAVYVPGSVELLIGETL